jgi:uncharacterized surface anchored protein
VKDFIAPIPVNITNCAGIKVVKTDGTTGAALDGAEFTLYKDNAPVGGSRGAEDTSTGQTCTTVGGECSFSNVSFGDYWVVESKTPTGYNTAPDQHVTLGSGGGDATVTFVDPRQKGAVQVIKTDDAGNVMTGIQFSLKGTSDLGTAVDTTCTTGLDGKCTFSNIELGTYTLDEIAGSLPAEYSKDPSLPKSVHVASDGQTVTVNVANPRKHKVIVVVCHEGTNSLFSVSVDKGTTTLQSLGTAPSGFTDAQLCGLGGAAFTHLDHGDVDLTVHLAQHP